MENKNRILLNHAMTYGAILGLILSLSSFFFWATGFTKTNILNSIFIGILNITLYAVVAAVGTKKYRNNILNGTISYGDALITGLYIIIFSGVITGFFNVLLQFVIDPNYYTNLMQATQEWMEKFMYNKGIPEEQIEEAINKLKEKGKQPSIAWVFFGGIIGAAIWGLIVSLITSAFIKKEPDIFEKFQS